MIRLFTTPYFYRYLIVLLPGILLSTLETFGQAAAPALSPRPPLAPTTAALEQYITMPVSEHTGVPDISIPLFTVQSRTLSVPVSLSYHAGGIRVSDEASWVGLGWSLLAGGQISRQLNGLPDEHAPTGFLRLGRSVPQADTLEELADHELLHQIAAGSYYDYEPDVFSFNFPEGSGQFIFGNDGLPHPVNYTALKIAADWSGRGHFTITALSGNRYVFADWESTWTDQRQVNGEEHVSSWYLSQIISADDSDTISFEYQRHSLQLPSTLSQSITMTETGVSAFARPVLPNPGTLFRSQHRSQAMFKAVKLQRIQTATSQLEFLTEEDPNAQRYDVYSDKRLQAIRLLTRTGQGTWLERRRLELRHSYFNAEPGQTPDRRTARLRLDAVVETGAHAASKTHSLTYSSVALPSRDSFARDHWGYYNGKDYNTELLPVATYLSQYGPRVLGSANRQLDEQAMQAAILQRITYPTGGYADFELETNRYGERYVVPRPRITEHVAAEGDPDETFKAIVEKQRFTVTTSTDSVVARLQVSADYPPDFTTHRHGAVYLYDVTTEQRVLLSSLVGRGYKEEAVSPVLQPGHTYELVASADNTYAQASIAVSWYDATNPVQYAIKDVLAGGLRVKAITWSAGAGQPHMTKRYTYTQADPVSGNTISSGYLTGLRPTYVYRQATKETTLLQPTANTPSMCYEGAEGLELVMTSSPIGQVSASSAPVAYRSVTVEDSHQQGKTVSRYSSEQDGGHNNKPFPAIINNAWLRGQLLERHVFALVNNTYVLRSQERNTYSFDSTHTQEVQGFKAVAGYHLYGAGCYFPESSYNYQGKYTYENTVQFTRWRHLDSTTIWQYNPTGTLAQRTTKAYHYDNPAHGLLTREHISTTGGEQLITTYRYAQDIARTGPASVPTGGIQQLLDRHMVSTLIEKLTHRQQPSGRLLVGAQAWQYRYLRPVEHWDLELARPVAAATFLTTTEQSGALQLDARYRKKTVVEQYDAFGNVAQVRPTQGPPTTLLWSYQGQYLLAEIKNARLDQVQTALSAATLTRLQGLTPGTDAGVQQELHALRSALPQAVITTYTHSPGVGITSQRGPDGRTVFYEYDGLGRLLRVRDEQGRVLSENEYHYAQP